MRFFTLTAALLAFCIVVFSPVIYLYAEILSGPSATWKELSALWVNERTISLWTTSLLIAAGTAFMAVLLGVPTGALISRGGCRGRGMAAWLMAMPLAIPSYINGIAWMEIVDGLNHWFSTALKGTGIHMPAVSLYHPLGVIWVLGWSYFPLVGFLTMAGLAGLDHRLEEQGRLAANDGTVLRRITFPLLMPFILGGAMVVFVLAAANFGVGSLLRVNTYPFEIFTQFSAFYDHRQAALSAVPFFLLTLGMTLLSAWFLRDRRYVTLSWKGRRHAGVRFSKYWWGTLWVWLILTVSAFLPLMVLTLNAGAWPGFRAAMKSAWLPLLTSWGISAAAASLCLVLAFFVAYFWERRCHQKRFHWTKDLISLMPLGIPSSILGISLIRLWNHPSTSWIYGGWMIVVLAYTAAFIAFAMKAMTGAFGQVKWSLEDAAILNGAGFGQIAARILWPMVKPAAIVAWSLCFVFAMGEFAVTLLVVPAGMETLSSRIFALMHYGVGKVTNALAIILVAGTLVPAAVMGWVLSRGRSYD